MSVEIPIAENDQSRFTQVTPLEGVDFLFEFRWNEREQRWYMDVRSVDGESVFMGVKIVADWSLLRLLVRDDDRPAGEIYAHDTTGAGDPRLGELGTRVRLIYIPEAEL